MIRIFIIVTTFFSFSLFAQKTYWKFEKTTPILATAIDIEFIVEEISKGDYVIYDENNNSVLLYSNSDYLKKPFEFEKKELKKKIIGDRIKLLYRPGVNDIYMLTFSKTSEKDFNDNMKKK